MDAVIEDRTTLEPAPRVARLGATEPESVPTP